MSWGWGGSSRVRALAGSEEEAVDAEDPWRTGRRRMRADEDDDEGFRNFGGAAASAGAAGPAAAADQQQQQQQQQQRPAAGDDVDVTLEDGGRHLVKAMSNWFIPRHGPPPGAGGEPMADGFPADRRGMGADDVEESNTWNPVFPASLSPPVGRPGVGPFAPRQRVIDGDGKDASFRSRTDSIKVDITFSTAEMNLKRDLKRHYLALAIGCWIFLTVTQSVSLICLNYWEYAPVVIALSIMAASVVFYWRYVWAVLRLPFRRLWETPYPYSAAAAVLGSLAQHAMFLIYEGYELGQLLIVFFMIQAFYAILVASTFRHYMSKWQRFLNHRKLCFDSLQMGLAKAEHRQELLLLHD